MKTKDRILDKAIELFNELGVHRVGVRDIARALNMSPGNLSYHFSKKEDLVVEIITRYSAGNDTEFEAYFSQPPSVELFLELMRQIFERQYKIRGLFTGPESSIHSFASQTNYQATEQKRRNSFREIFEELGKNGELSLTKEDVDFLGSFISLLGRFWMVEAFVSFRERPKEEIIAHYLGMVRKQLSLFGHEAV